jgi:TPP-dependent pyruvate/acetoin dehydrogenase alpha subunit
VHLCSGQEATNVGVISALEPRDVIASHHRGHGHCLARGAEPDLLMAEILGKAAGYGGGRSGSMHVIDLEHGNLGTNGIVGGGIPLACGAALAARARNTGAVSVCFFGDGALNQGLLHECMNMAAIWKLAVVFVCENNGYGEFTAIDDVTAGDSIPARGEVFGIPSQTIDGMDVLAVRKAALAAVARARKGEGPSFLICNTWRFGGHHVGDKQDYKDEDEAKAWRAKDPLPRFAAWLTKRHDVSPRHLAGLQRTAKELAEASVDFARRAPEPEAMELDTHVYG